MKAGRCASCGEPVKERRACCGSQIVSLRDVLKLATTMAVLFAFFAVMAWMKLPGPGDDAPKAGEVAGFMVVASLSFVPTMAFLWWLDRRAKARRASLAAAGDVAEV